jgi:hypothetical protein
MYLLYDVIQRRKSALGNSLFVKRGDYEEMQQIISSLSFDQLIAAAQSLRSTQTTSDPAIAVLRRAVQTVAARVPNSFAEKQEMRLYLRGLFIEFGPAAFWLDNPQGWTSESQRCLSQEDCEHESGSDRYFLRQALHRHPEGVGMSR